MSGLDVGKVCPTIGFANESSTYMRVYIYLNHLNVCMIEVARCRLQPFMY